MKVSTKKKEANESYPNHVGYGAEAITAVKQQHHVPKSNYDSQGMDRAAVHNKRDPAPWQHTCHKHERNK